MNVESILNYYKDELKWNPPFADILSKYSPEGLKGYLVMRESIQNGHLPKKTSELIFTILDSLDDEVSGAKAHAVLAIEAGLTVEELVEAFVIVTLVKGINVLCKTGVEVIKSAEKRSEEIKLSKVVGQFMSEFETAIELMKTQLGHNVEIPLATCFNGKTSVRIVNGYYKDGAIYVMTHTSTHKMQEISINPNVSICKNLLQAWGISENIGNPKEEKNKVLAKELKEVFIAFYESHVNEDDSGCCILKINLNKAIVFDEEAKYVIDYKNRTSTKIPMKVDVIYQ